MKSSFDGIPKTDLPSSEKKLTVASRYNAVPGVHKIHTVALRMCGIKIRHACVLIKSNKFDLL